MLTEHELVMLTNFCQDNLPLKGAVLAEEYFYQSLSLCVIDALYSINVRYESTRQVVLRYCRHYNVKKIRDNRSVTPLPVSQESISELLQHFKDTGVEHMTEKVFDNRQLTSPRNGIRKGEAVYRFAKVLQQYNVNYFQDVPSVMNNSRFADAFKSIPGQGSGISLKYFFMLSGSDDLVKPDRMIKRFIANIINREISEQQTEFGLKYVCQRLNEKHAEITPRLLDNLIWNYQRAKRV